MRTLPLLLVALSACVAGPAERPLSVRYVVENAEALDGREIVLSGWIDHCERLSCALYDSAEEIGKDWAYFLSIAPSSWFDPYIRGRAPTRVTLRARLHDRCIVNPATQIIGVCADRGGSLEVLAIVR